MASVEAAISRTWKIRFSAVMLLVVAMPLLACSGLSMVIGFKRQAEQVRELGRIECRVDT